MNNKISSYLSKFEGPLFASMTNDYLFRALAQSDELALKGLICALLKISFDDIKSLEITNPIELGKSMDKKEAILDLKLILNSNTIINIEMQVANEDNWPERSLSYLCKCFDNVNKGDDYISVKPAIHIGILDFTLFEEHPEFYAAYKMLNTKTFYPYTNKFVLHALDLTKINLATAEDKEYDVDVWAKLFKANTWEELKMLAEKNRFIDNAVVTIAKLSEDEKLRQEIEAHEEFLKIQRTRERRMAMLMDELEKKNTELEEKTTALAEKDTALAQKEEQLAIKEAKIKELQQLLTQKPLA